MILLASGEEHDHHLPKPPEVVGDGRIPRSPLDLYWSQADCTLPLRGISGSGRCFSVDMGCYSLLEQLKSMVV